MNSQKKILKSDLISGREMGLFFWSLTPYLTKFHNSKRARSRLLFDFLAISFLAITAKTVEVGEKCLSVDPSKIGPSESFKRGLRSLRVAVFEIQGISLI